MNTVISTSKAEKEVYNHGGAIHCGSLIRGRTPIAHAEICGECGYTNIKGEAVFYYTPLGMFVCASVSGLDGTRGVYSLSLVGEGRDSGSCAIPPLYDRNGYAWCSALTGKISPRELLGRKIAMRQVRAGVERDEIASGVIRASGE